MSSPLEMFNKKNPTRWEVLSDFPSWEKGNVLDWVHGILNTTDTFGRKSYQYTILTSIQSTERIMFFADLGISITDWSRLLAELTRLIKSSKQEEIEKVVLFVELLVKYIRDSNSYHSFGDSRDVHASGKLLNLLEASLSNGSKWTIVRQQGAESGLIERVSPELLAAAQASKNDDLHKAWSYAFGASPKPEQAILHAQSAIEYIASKSGLTNATSGVYGAIIGDITTHKGALYQSIAKPEFDKVLALIKKSGSEIDDKYAQWVADGMDLIQKTNPSRHKSTETETFRVSVESARQAVLIATVIFEIIQNKYITKKTKK